MDFTKSEWAAIALCLLLLVALPLVAQFQSEAEFLDPASIVVMTDQNTENIKIEERMNSLEREIIQFKMNRADSWMYWMAVFMTMAAVLVAVIGIVTSSRIGDFRREAETFRDRAKYAADEAEAYLERSKTSLDDVTAEVLASRQISTTEKIDKVENDPDATFVDKVISQAAKLQEQEEYEQAIGQWRLLTSPEDDGITNEIASNAWFSIAYLLSLGDNLVSSKWREIVECYTKSIALDPNGSAAYNNRGIAYGSLGLVDEEVSDYKAAIALWPASPEAHSNLGKTLFARGQFEEAIESYTAALNIKSIINAHAGRSEAFEESGDLDRAKADIERAIDQARQEEPERVSQFVERLKGIDAKIAESNASNKED